MAKLAAPLPLLLLFLGAYPQATALEAEDVLFFKFGPLSLRPQIGTSEVYNDNIFYSTKPVADFLTILSPGLKLQLGRPEHNYINLSYNLDQFFYADNSDLNTQQHNIEIHDRFESQRLTLTGSDRFQFLSSPLGGVVERVAGPNGAIAVSGQNVDRTSIDDAYTLTYALGDKTATYVRANHYDVGYQQDVGLYDIQTLTGTAGFAYRAFSKTVLFGELYYGQTRTEPNGPGQPRNPRLDFFGGYVGARGNFTEKLSGIIKVGYEAREFGDGTSPPSDPVADLSLTQRFSEKQSLSLTYSRQSNVSVQYTRQLYTSDAIGLQFTQILGPSQKWKATLGGSYSMYSYEQVGSLTAANQYDYIRASAGLSYQIQRWLTASAGYDFERVSGNSRSVIDYNVNRVNLRLNIGF